MERREITNWRKQAEADFRTANNCHRSKDYYAAVFFCQQAAEKMLKAYYIFKKREEPTKTHNIFELGSKLQMPAEFLTVCKRLAPEFVISRYPDAIDGVPAELYDENSASEMIQKTGRLLKWLRSQMGKS